MAGALGEGGEAKLDCVLVQLSFVRFVAPVCVASTPRYSEFVDKRQCLTRAQGDLTFFGREQTKVSRRWRGWGGRTEMVLGRSGPEERLDGEVPEKTVPGADYEG